MNLENAAVALCAPGVEKTLCNELRKLSEASGTALRIEAARAGRVLFVTGTRGLYLALMGLRCADRVLAVCGRFPARDFDELFLGVRAAPLEEFIPRDMPLVIEKARSNRSALAAETSIQAVTHKAVAERLCAAHGLTRLPEPAAQNETAAFRVYIENDETLLLLDLCGEPLFKRGYRSEGGAAPLRETLAAFFLLSSLWKRKHPLYDPFCGSGTILIEAALYAWNIAPGINRKFAMQNLLCADAKIESEARSFFAAQADISRLVQISGSDKDAGLIEVAKRNAARALGEAAKKIHFAAIPAEASMFWAGGAGGAAGGGTQAGYIITNPPYGLRLGDEAESEKHIASLAALRRRCAGWKLAAISDNEGFESFFGLKASRCREVQCGAIKRYVFEYEPSAAKPPRAPSPRISPSSVPSPAQRANQTPRTNPAQTQKPAQRQSTTWTW